MSHPFNQGQDSGFPGQAPGFTGGAPSFGSASAPQSAGPTGASGTTAASTGFASGPWGPLAAALAAAVAGLLLALILAVSPVTATDSSYPWLAGGAWLLCGVVAFILLGLYTIQDNKLRAERPYMSNPTQQILYRVTVGVGVVGVVVSAIEIALWFSKF